jgi:DHA2 family methylenomycin A resistance protein-like MFS transporter
VSALTVSIVALATFLITELRGAHPMVPLELFRSTPIAVSVSGGFTFTFGFYGLVFLLSLYFQELRGLSPSDTGLAFMPMTALAAFLTLLTPRFATRFGPRVPMAVGQLLMAVGLLALAVAATNASTVLMSALTIPIGLGAALSVPTLTALLVGSVPSERAGIASGVLNTSRQVGGAIAVALFGALVAHRETFLMGMQVSLLIAVLMLLATAVASLSLLAAPAPLTYEAHQ